MPNSIHTSENSMCAYEQIFIYTSENSMCVHAQCFIHTSENSMCAYAQSSIYTTENSMCAYAQSSIYTSENSMCAYASSFVYITYTILCMYEYIHFPLREIYLYAVHSLWAGVAQLVKCLANCWTMGILVNARTAMFLPWNHRQDRLWGQRNPLFVT
jgi:hypothetical protein